MIITKQTSIVAHHGPTSPMSGKMIGSVAVDLQSGGYPWASDHRFPEQIRDVNQYFMDKASKNIELSEYSDKTKRIGNDIRVFFSKYHDDICGENKQYQLNKNIDIIVSSIEIDFSDIFNIKTKVLRKIRLIGLESDDERAEFGTRVQVFEMPV